MQAGLAQFGAVGACEAVEGVDRLRRGEPDGVPVEAQWGGTVVQAVDDGDLVSGEAVLA
ncbi:hypothetical protein AB0C33_15645 [Nonomuraea sp. NPDC048881]|uniref:hypothetical protein n=1 Tax=Nonomuraea sp. NPDC048881 TaxID=3155030 RepID=UPI0033E31894